jgi:transposase
MAPASPQTLVVRMPELGALSSGEAASLTGMGPFTRKSARWQGQFDVVSGRVGRALFAATQAASQRWNPQLLAIEKRLHNAGKHHSIAIVACTRKLIINANTILARKTHRRPALNSCFSPAPSQTCG